MSAREVRLVAHSVWYLSQVDEDMFFTWLEQLPCVLEFHGDVRDLIITLKDETVDDECLRELLALFYRYDVEMSQLATFETDENRSWFRDPCAYWYDKVFSRLP